MSSAIGGVVAAARPCRVFIATWVAWMLDGFDNAIYICVIVPALTELLPRSGFAADHAHVDRRGGLMFSLFMRGWAGNGASGATNLIIRLPNHIRRAAGRRWQSKLKERIMQQGNRQGGSP